MKEFDFDFMSKRRIALGLSLVVVGVYRLLLCSRNEFGIGFYRWLTG